MRLGGCAPAALAVPVLEKLLVKGGALPWACASAELLSGSSPALAALPIDHSVAPGTQRGGSAAAGIESRKPGSFFCRILRKA